MQCHSSDVERDVVQCHLSDVARDVGHNGVCILPIRINCELFCIWSVLMVLSVSEMHYGGVWSICLLHVLHVVQWILSPQSIGDRDIVLEQRISHYVSGLVHVRKTVQT